MMIGVPCVASDIASNSQVIAHGVTGLLVEATSTTALAQAILQMLDDQKAAAQIVLRARERIAEHYRLDRSVAGNASLYESLAFTLSGIQTHRSPPKGVAAPIGDSHTWP
jgi:glycosyltransferase involved in cell wall biosynthesis